MDYLLIFTGTYLMIAVAVLFILCILQTSEIYRTNIQMLREDFKTTLWIALLWFPMALICVTELRKIVLAKPAPREQVQASLNYGAGPDELRHPNDPSNTTNNQ